MKYIFLMFLLLAATFNIAAQVSKVSDLDVVKKKWIFAERSVNSSIDNSDPFAANDDQREFVRATKDNMRQNDIRTAQGLPRLPPPTRNVTSAPPASETEKLSSRTGNYLYQIEVKNTGQKTISSVTWDYVFLDTAKNQEAGRRHFTSIKDIRAGESKSLSERSGTYPTETIDASAGGKKFSTRYSEQIIIQEIHYSDGTAWKASAN